jgi:hypothetical protein
VLNACVPTDGHTVRDPDGVGSAACGRAVAPRGTRLSQPAASDRRADLVVGVPAPAPATRRRWPARACREPERNTEACRADAGQGAGAARVAATAAAPACRAARQRPSSSRSSRAPSLPWRVRACRAWRRAQAQMAGLFASARIAGQIALLTCCICVCLVDRTQAAPRRSRRHTTRTQMRCAG